MPCAWTYTCSMDSRATELRLALLLGAILSGLFVAWPQIDLAASGLFYRDGAWLLPRESPWLVLPYRGTPRLGQAVVLAIAMLWILGFSQHFPRIKARHGILGFLLAGALAGPVALVDLGLKDHSGRARPINVQAFGGEKRFTPAFVPADQCRKNCAFVSGHVATASFLMAFGWLGAPRVRRRWLGASIAVAAAMGLCRMVPGGHFLSDVVFAWFAVYLSLWLTEWVLRRLGALPVTAVPTVTPPG